MAIHIRRREFIVAFGGTAVAWPLAPRAEQPEPMRRIGVMIEFDEKDPEAKAYPSGLTRGLAQLGWIDGRNVRIDIRWAAASVERMQVFAKELVDLRPDVIVTSSTPVTAAVQRETQTIPIVFVTVADPIGAGFVASLPHPGGNLTGFANLEKSIAGKCLGLLMDIAPSVKRVAAIFNPDTNPGGGSFFLPSFEAAARSLNVEPITAPVRSDAEIEMVITALGREPGGGIVALPDAFMGVHRAAIISVAAKNKVPAVGGLPQSFARDGGLVSYGADIGDLFRRAAPYVDRILRGTKPAELPVQLPIKFEMVVNLKTAKALGLTVPQKLIYTADEVIE
jgi:putative tryptophan/tyrosine transport system substrate-binding protein